jgi:hypothetical protein
MDIGRPTDFSLGSAIGLECPGRDFVFDGVQQSPIVCNIGADESKTDGVIEMELTTLDDCCVANGNPQISSASHSLDGARVACSISAA